MINMLMSIQDRITRLGVWLSSFCLLAIVFCYSYEVVARYIFNAPAWWSNEFVSYFLAIGCFLMLPEVTRVGGHVAVTIVPDSLSKKNSKLLIQLIQLASFLTCLLAVWISFSENMRQIIKSVYLINVVPVPKVWISIWITYGFANSALYFLRFFLSSIFSNALYEVHGDSENKNSPLQDVNNE